MTGINRSQDWWLKRISTEPDCPITAGVPTERDRLWTIQQYAAIGIEETGDTGPLADLFAAIHREAASGLASNEPIRNEASAVTKGGLA
ncbi:MAG: hypothetical protein WA940_09150 [Sphingopyxis sp.]